MNSQLWSRLDEDSQKRTLFCWFKDNNIDLNNIFENIEDTTIEELRNLYIYYETHMIN